MNIYLELLLSLGLIGVGVAVARVRNLFALIVLLSAFSGLMATMFALLGAPDVAFTEAVVGSGVSTLFLMALIRKLDAARIGLRQRIQQLAALAVALGVTGVLAYGVSMLPSGQDAGKPASEHVARAYLERAYHDMHTPNVVTAVLADYRSFDTMIEATVVLTAALAVVLILGTVRDDRREATPDEADDASEGPGADGPGRQQGDNTP